MAHKAIIRMLHSVSRSEFERRLGGDFEQVPDAPERRQNGRFVTYKDYSQKVQERKACWVKPLFGDPTPLEWPTWTAAANALGLYYGKTQ